MELLRTPEERFSSLPGFAFPFDAVEVGEPPVRMVFVEAGHRKGPCVLLLHGEPTWSFLYRRMIPLLADSGARVLAPDLIGFGRSDKPASTGDYSYERHVGWLKDFVHRLDLRDITLFCQDWGGLLGLRLVAEEPERFARVVASNTFLPDGTHPLPAAFDAWRRYSQSAPALPIENIIRGGCVGPLSPEVLASYAAPFPTAAHQAGARAFPTLVPTSPRCPSAAENARAWAKLAHFEKPFLTLFSDRDPITRGCEARFREEVPGARGQAHRPIRDAGHFVQEDQGPELAHALLEFMGARGSAR